MSRELKSSVLRFVANHLAFSQRRHQTTPLIHAPQTLPFFRFPAEIRNEIYRFSVASPEALTSFRQPALTRASRKLRDESLGIFFAENSFDLSIRETELTILSQHCELPPNTITPRGLILRLETLNSPESGPRPSPLRHVRRVTLRFGTIETRMFWADLFSDPAVDEVCWLNFPGSFSTPYPEALRDPKIRAKLCRDQALVYKRHQESSMALSKSTHTQWESGDFENLLLLATRLQEECPRAKLNMSLQIYRGGECNYWGGECIHDIRG